MAYTSNTLGELSASIGGRNRWWTYETADAIGTILGAGYVSDAANKRMQVGDVIFCRFATLNTTGPDQSPSTHARGTVSEFAAAPSYAVLMVDAISAGAATLKTAKTETITDNSGGTANAATGVVANLAKQTVQIPVQLADLATGTLKIALPFAFTVTGTPQFRVAKPATTAAKAATATLQVNGVAATGGVISLTSTNCTPMGAAVAASAAVTAGGTGTAGQTVEFALSSVTAFAEGDGWFEVTVIDNDLANAIATLIKF